MVVLAEDGRALVLVPVVIGPYDENLVEIREMAAPGGVDLSRLVLASDGPEVEFLVGLASQESYPTREAQGVAELRPGDLEE